jgi:hypothetical protein
MSLGPAGCRTLGMLMISQHGAEWMQKFVFQEDRDRLGRAHFEEIGLVAILGQDGEDLFQRDFVQLRCAGEHPAVLAIGCSNDCPLVGLVEADDPVVAPERSPTKKAHKTYFEFRIAGGIDDFGDALGVVKVAVTLETPVQHSDAPVFAQGVFGGRTALAVLLEAIWNLGDFIPQADVALQVDCIDRGNREFVQVVGRGRSSAAQVQYCNQKKPSY